ncbi:hypothetical protein [Methanogenium organophilum]|uniref:Uncharacterized protein n=1 Tax=Methanogenium organophilum TaxID=2199 RepID=A0A9X9T812_METOG|nr:hypothetical protein [Methanogenium organophilum]WAI00687.1 hypothetical protein OU421_09660 [Methanogenium organophilum]
MTPRVFYGKNYQEHQRRKGKMNILCRIMVTASLSKSELFTPDASLEETNPILTAIIDKHHPPPISQGNMTQIDKQRHRT